MIVAARGRASGWMAAARLMWGDAPTQEGGLVLAYHDVGPIGSGFTARSVSPARLREQVVAARAWNLRFVTLSALVDTIGDGGDARGMVALTFDDALVGVHRHALPLLAELGLPATVFAVSQAFGGPPRWWPGSADVMSVGQLSELAAAGWTVGSHSRTHSSLVGVAPRALSAEIRGSREDLEDLLQSPVDLLAYPYGHHDPAVRRAVASAGYRAAFTFLNGRVSPSLDFHRLPRLNMHQGLLGLRFARQVARPPTAWPDTQYDLVRHREHW